jgi:CRP-like cAMP-binding protein
MTSKLFASSKLRTNRQSFTAGSTIFAQGEKAKGAYLICAGCVRLVMRTKKGKIVLQRELSAGNIFGLPSLFTGKPFSMTAEAATESEVAFISQQQIVSAMQHDTGFGMELLELLAEEVQLARAAIQ